MARRLFTVASALSLLLCVAACVMWVRSYFRGDLVAVFTSRGTPPAASRYEWLFASDRGILLFVRNEHRGVSVGPYPPGSRTRVWSVYAPDGRFASADYGFGPLWLQRADIVVPSPTRTSRHAHVRISLWLIAAAAAVLPAVRLGRRWRDRRRRLRSRRGLCPRCGYDLRASPDRCPECGAVPEKILPISN